MSGSQSVPPNATAPTPTISLQTRAGMLAFGPWHPPLVTPTTITHQTRAGVLAFGLKDPATSPPTTPISISTTSLGPSR